MLFKSNWHGNADNCEPTLNENEHDWTKSKHTQLGTAPSLLLGSAESGRLARVLAAINLPDARVKSLVLENTRQGKS